MGNVSVAGLNSLLSNRYFVYEHGGAPGAVNVIFFSEGGNAHACFMDGGRKRQTKTNWKSNVSTLGFSGIQMGTKGQMKGKFGWPVIFDSDTGNLTRFVIQPDTSWASHVGWVQSGYSDVFAEICPKMPRTSLSYETHTGADFDTLAAQAKNERIKMNGITVFRSEYRKPLTAEMYYSNYPPEH